LAAAALALAVPLGIAGALADPPSGSKPAPQAGQGGKDSLDSKAKAAKEQELETIRAEQKKAADIQARLAKDIESIGEDRRKLNADLIDTAGRIRAAEGRMTATETRLKTLSGNESNVRRSLDGRHATIVEILAALQRMGRRPPPAILMSPDDALSSVRTAMLLGAVLPQMQAQANALANDLSELAHVRHAISTERETLTHDLAALSMERQRMSMLIEERQKKQADVEKALEGERQHAAALARQADNLKELIARLEQDAAVSARAVEPAGRAGNTNESLPNPDSGRLAPAIAFASAKGGLPLPVNGVKLRDFGAPDGLGGTEKGLWIASRAAAQVTSPCDGRVVYAGPFRSYGQLLILNAGGGYHVLLAGMERISVDLGQFVLTGEPVAVMGGGPQSAAAVTIGSSQPVLYVEFRKDGTPVDPGPWWATTDSQKVRG